MDKYRIFDYFFFLSITIALMAFIGNFYYHYSNFIKVINNQYLSSFILAHHLKTMTFKDLIGNIIYIIRLIGYLIFFK